MFDWQVSSLRTSDFLHWHVPSCRKNASRRILTRFVVPVSSSLEIFLNEKDCHRRMKHHGREFPILMMRRDLQVRHTLAITRLRTWAFRNDPLACQFILRHFHLVKMPRWRWCSFYSLFHPWKCCDWPPKSVVWLPILSWFICSNFDTKISRDCTFCESIDVVKFVLRLKNAHEPI